MKRLASMAWKEWHEVQWFVVAAAILFVGMPMIEGLELHGFHQRRFEFYASPWVYPLGGLLAIFTAVGITCRDLGERLEGFWRSRAISPVRWMLVKYIVGLLAVIACCIVPLLMEIKIDSFRVDRDVAGLMPVFSLLWVTLYSIAFFAGCLIRRTAQALMASIAGMLLIYFLPFVIPFMQWLNIERASGLAIAATYVSGMLAIAAIALALSLLSIARGWRIESGTKMMYWSIGSALLLLFSTAALRLATNLPILSQVNLPPGQRVVDIHLEGSRGVILTCPVESNFPLNAQWFELQGNHLTLGAQFPLAYDSMARIGQPVAWKGHVLYSVFTQQIDKKYTSELRMTDFDGSAIPTIISPHEISGFALLFIRDERLYMTGRNLSTFDIHVPTEPRLLGTEKIAFGKYPREATRGQLIWPLLLIPGFSEQEDLQITFELNHREFALDGDILCSSTSDGLDTAKLLSIKDGVARFAWVGQYTPSLLERVFGSVQFRPVAGGGRVYLSEENTRTGKRTEGVNVFDIRDPCHPHPIGHFAIQAEHSQVVQLLPDGRSILGGDQLLLLGRPPTRD